MPKQDERTADYNKNREIDEAVTQRLADAGFRKREDLGPGRADVGAMAEMIKDIDPEIDPLIAEKAIRDKNYVQMAGGVEEPAPPAEAPSPETAPAEEKPDRLTALETSLKTMGEENERFKKLYGQSENQKGDLRKELAELKARAGNGTQPRTPTPQPAGDFATIYGKPADEPITMGDVVNLMMAQQAGTGAELQRREQSIMDSVRALQGYDLTTNEEATLLERHPALVNLDRAAQMKVMSDMAGTLRKETAPAPSPAPQPKTGISLEELARAKLRSANTFIEPSTQGSHAEVAATASGNEALQKKLAKFHELAGTPGGAEEMKKIIASLSSGARRR